MTRWTIDFEALAAGIWPKWGSPCWAKTRFGSKCRGIPVAGKRRCRMHGEQSTGPRSAEGRAAIVRLVKGGYPDVMAAFSTARTTFQIPLGVRFRSVE